jgi:hypothetical protein
VQELASKAYEKASAAQGGGEDQQAEPGADQQDASGGEGEDGPVDADYEVVDDDKK